MSTVRRPDSATATPSLQRRVTVVAVALLAVLLLTLGVVINATLDALATRNLHERLAAATARAETLAAAHTPPELLADQLNGGIVRALVVTADGASYGDPAIEPDTAAGRVDPPPLEPDDTATVVVRPLATGGRVILVADTTETAETLRQLRQLMVGAGLGTLVMAALLLTAASRAALRPLKRLTDLAKDITTGDRGRRLRPDQAGTDLGRAASAFDDMLDALEASEHQAGQAAQAAQRAEAATRRFLADAAHELRTPIAGIQAAAEQVASNASQDETDPAALRQHRRATLLLTDARRATRLVTDMLDLSYIDAGLSLERKEIDLAAVVNAEVDQAAMLAPQLTMDRTGLPTLAVRADPTRVAQILSNLLDNARRYTASGGRITIDVQRRAGAEVTVTDTGPGIPADERDHIFERLVRLDTARARGQGGAGLGLPIARALARAQGGDLVCLPHDGGASFRLELPFDAESP